MRISCSLFRYRNCRRTRGQVRGNGFSEIVATFGLLCVVLLTRRSRDAPWRVAAWVGAAYWFTASTSFANPAITIARAMTDTFAGIRPADVPGFIVAQGVGALLAAGTVRPLSSEARARSTGRRTQEGLVPARGFEPLTP